MGKPMSMRKQIFIRFVFVLTLPLLAASQPAKQVPPKSYQLTKKEYGEKVYAVWMAQIVGASMGWQFEHKQAAVKWVDDYPEAIKDEYRKNGGARLDDDWYYEMGTLRAFQKYGPNVTIEQLGQQWLENRVGSWGAGEWARINLERGIKAPMSGHPRYNRMWFTMGNQARGELYGLLAPGMPNLAARLSHELGHVSSYAEGTQGGVYVSAMVSLGFIQKDLKKNLVMALDVLPKDAPHYQCIRMVLDLYAAGKSHKAICNAVEDRWHIEYPATNNTVGNMGIIIASLLHGDSNFLKTINLAYQGGDFTDADNNGAIAGAMLASIYGLSIIPKRLLDVVQDRVKGTHVGPVEITPPVDMAVSELARQTAEIGQKVLAVNGIHFKNDTWTVPDARLVARPSENFSPNEFTRYWNPAWTLERAGFGAPGGGHRGLRGGTFLDGEVLSIFPRDETRGALLTRPVTLGQTPMLDVEVAADPGRAWKLEILVDHKMELSKLISGGDALVWDNIPDAGFPPPTEEYVASTKARKWEKIHLDLSKYGGQEVILRLYTHTYVRNRYPGNAYFRNLNVTGEDPTKHP